MAAECRTSDCRGCKWHFLSPSRDLRRPKGRLGPPGLSLTSFRSRECARVRVAMMTVVNAYISVLRFLPSSQELESILGVYLFPVVW